MGFAGMARQSYLNGGLGIRVERPAAALGVQGNRTLFTVVGQVFITFLTGYVTAILAAVAATVNIQLVSVAGTVNLGSGAVATNGIAAGSFLQFPDVAAAQPFTWVTNLITVANYAQGVGLGAQGWAMSTGSVRAVIGGADSTTGAVRWTCFYIPISENGRMTPGTT